MGLVDIFDPKNDRIGRVHSRDLGRVLDQGYQLHNASKEVRIFDPKTGRKGRVENGNLGQVLNNGYRLDESDYSDYGQAFTQGVGQGLGKLADTAVAAGNLINTGVGKVGASIADTVGATDTANKLQEFSDESFSHAKDFWQNPKIEQLATEALDTGLNHEKGIRVAQSAGDAVGTLPAFGAAGKGIQALTKVGKVANVPWISKLNKFLDVPINASSTGTFAAMGAGAETLKSDDPQTSAVENFGREIVGGLMGGAVIPHYSQKAAKSIWDSVNDGNLRASILRRFGKEVDVDGYNALKNVGVEPTPEIISQNNKLIGWLGRKRSEAADSVIKNASEQSFSDIEQNLEKHLGEFVGRNETDLRSASASASDVFKTEADKYLAQMQGKKTELYDNAISLLGETNPLANDSLIEINKQLKRVYAPTATSTSETGQGLVASSLMKLKKAWSQDGKALAVDPHEMLAQIKAFGEMQATGKTKSYTKLLSSVSEAIEKDLIAAGNHEFAHEYNIAKEFYKDEIVPYVKTDIGKALLTGDAPKAAYSMTGTAENIRSLKAMVKRQPNGEKLVDIVLRTRAQEKILDSSFKDGTFKPNNFINLFTQSKNDEYLFELLGKSYAPIKENILPIARAIQRTDVGAGATGGNLRSMALNLVPKALANIMLKPKVADRMIAAAKKDNDKLFNRILEGSLSSLKKNTKILQNNSAIKTSVIRSVINSEDQDQPSPFNDNPWK